MENNVKINIIELEQADLDFMEDYPELFDDYKQIKEATKIENFFRLV